MLITKLMKFLMIGILVSSCASNVTKRPKEGVNEENLSRNIFSR